MTRPDLASVVLAAVKHDQAGDGGSPSAASEGRRASPSERTPAVADDIKRDGTLNHGRPSDSPTSLRSHDGGRPSGTQAARYTTEHPGDDLHSALAGRGRPDSVLRGPFHQDEKDRGSSMTRAESVARAGPKTKEASHPRFAGSAAADGSERDGPHLSAHDHTRPFSAARPSSMLGTLARMVLPTTQGVPEDAEEGEGDEATEDGRRFTSAGPSTMTQADGDPKKHGASTAGARWAALRQRIRGDHSKTHGNFSAHLNGSELVRDLSVGLLPIMMVKMGLMDRDEHDQHRIPILMGYMKLRVTDSVYPFHNAHALFRIELEYGDGLMKWVIYREMRDFINLHAHYRLANLRSNIEQMPSFPKTSLPYLQALSRENREKGKKAPGKSDFARLQREALEAYLLKLIRATMFVPQANRLCKFLEFSALGLVLATGGGYQGKQGYLRVLNSGASRKTLGFHPITFVAQHEPKWFIVRESYIVAVDEPDQTQPWEVFMIDSSFQIERPKRLYRVTLNAATGNIFHKARDKDATADEGDARPEAQGRAPSGRLGDPNDPSTTDATNDDPKELVNASNHTFHIRNAQNRIKLVAKNERQMDQFIASIERMAKRTAWAGKNRFGSFAPIRLNVAAQWLVDGRDYYWNLSRAILLAKEKIYIHDWWLSPELFLRRPPGENGKWRLDRLLQRKAEEGVRIYVIVYNEVSNDFTPVDSLYAKTRLVGLHPNIMVQRSPSHTQTRTLLWSHHEKMCVVDETIAFMGGFDLCFGRWDTPQHTLVDEGTIGLEEMDKAFDNGELIDGEEGQIWPGKDYSNQRVADFHNLHRPEQDMYDRNRVPRQPWHDIGLQIVGQPARDLCRHFVMRWNHLLRVKTHSRFMPFLMPPPDFTAAELQKKRIAGTCEAQICRSAGPWSMGTMNHVEHSIQTAYVKAIQLSDHFVYIENQFFVTSTIADNVIIENQIGDALVDRIVRAAHEGTEWRAIIIIPLVPGYPMPLDSPDAGSSIFGRLRKSGVHPEDYIAFFSLRSWGRLKSGLLCTQDIYIHAKTMVVDDRIVIIGSANINERSQRGDRDSELACVIRDTDMVDGTMAGQPYRVGRFARSLRIRLMREHLGIDVDELETAAADGQLLSRPPVQNEASQEHWDPDQQQEHGIGDEDASQPTGLTEPASSMIGSVANDASQTAKGIGQMFAAGRHRAHSDVANKVEQAQGKLDGDRSKADDGKKGEAERIAANEETTDTTRAQSAAVPSVEQQAGVNGDVHEPESDAHQSVENGSADPASPKKAGVRYAVEGEHDAKNDDRRESVSSYGGSRSRGKSVSTVHSAKFSNDVSERKLRASLGGKMSVYSIPTAAPEIDPNGFDDPICDEFYLRIWTVMAARNTQIYRKVFRCTPDDLCLTWSQFKEWELWCKRHEKPIRDLPTADPVSSTAGGPGATGSLEASESILAQSSSNTSEKIDFSRSGTSGGQSLLDNPAPTSEKKSKPGKVTDEGFTKAEVDAMTTLLEQVSGNLVLYPTRFLESEDLASNEIAYNR